MDRITVVLDKSILPSLNNLTKPIKNKFQTFTREFEKNPWAPGIKLHKVKSAQSNNIYTAYVDDAYRCVVAQHEGSGVFFLLWVDHHDDAYRWAERKCSKVNKNIVCIQNFSVPEFRDAVDSNEEKLFSEFSDTQLQKIGLPDELLSFVRTLSDESDFYNAKEYIPDDPYEALDLYLHDEPINEILKAYSHKPAIDVNDIYEVLTTERSQRSFHVIDSEDELERIIEEPLEKWRIFLHPTQRKIVEQNYNGPCRILGGAGTGKTVVAMHRAKWLASQLKNNERILFTTYTANLAKDIEENLRKICSDEEIRKIEVINFDAWVKQYLKKCSIDYDIKYESDLKQLWADAISSSSNEDLDLPDSFYPDEWANVVTVQETFTKEEYIHASRLKRGYRLDRKKRMQVWNVFEKYISLMKKYKARDIDTAICECRRFITKKTDKSYSTVIVDEGQDFSSNAYKLLRVLASDEHKNDMFIVGDAHQRIYNKRAVLSKCGINIRGRSSILRINYRTTEETRKYAFAILKDIPFDNLDGEYETEYHCQSLTHGDDPIVKHFRIAKEELDYIIDEVKNLAAKGVKLRDICIVAKKSYFVEKYKNELSNAGIRAYEIKQYKPDERSLDGVRVATMHRVKGLEFQYVFIAAVNKDIIPYSSVMEIEDSIAKRDAITSEKCLLYVALTRAQKAAYITSYGRKSEFLSNK